MTIRASLISPSPFPYQTCFSGLYFSPINTPPSPPPTTTQLCIPFFRTFRATRSQVLISGCTHFLLSVVSGFPHSHAVVENLVGLFFVLFLIGNFPICLLRPPPHPPPLPFSPSPSPLSIHPSPPPPRRFHMRTSRLVGSCCRYLTAIFPPVAVTIIQKTALSTTPSAVLDSVWRLTTLAYTCNDHTIGGILRMKRLSTSVCVCVCVSFKLYTIMCIKMRDFYGVEEI